MSRSEQASEKEGAGKTQESGSDEREPKKSSESKYQKDAEQSSGGKDSKDKSDDQKDEKSADENGSLKKKPKEPPIYKTPAFIITVSVVAVVILIVGIFVWRIVRQYVSTDDAYVDGHKGHVEIRLVDGHGLYDCSRLGDNLHDVS
jgi:membrane fusion protein, multidrug efflux system